MYNNSPRFGLTFPSSTPPEIGPSTYILDDPYYIKRVNVVPFASSSSRKTSTQKIPAIDVFYEIRDIKHIVGGHSLRNKANRFVRKVSDIPPPGSYNVSSVSSKRKYDLRDISGKGRLYLCKVPYSFLGSAPSVPSKRDAKGYNIGAAGQLIKNVIPDTKVEPGPSSYFVKVSSCVFTDPYRGCHWSRRTSQRGSFKTNEGPGPSDYDTNKISVCRRNEREEEYREMARRFTYMPRYTEQQQLVALRQNHPSACQYNIPSYFDYKPPITTIKKPFITKKPRFEEKSKDERIHTIYDLSVRMGEKLTPSFKKVPFSVATERFKDQKKFKSDGSGMFKPKGFAEEIYEKSQKVRSLFKPPFNSTNSRNISLVPPDSHFKPDCTTYPREKFTPSCKTQKNTNVFASTTNRSFFTFSDVPPASKYSIAEPFDKIKSKTSHNKKKLAFNSSEERKTVVLPLKDNPGPSDYIGKEGIKGRGYFFDQTQRFKDEVSKSLPPDHYYIHPMYGESMYGTKHTFNLMIAESVLKKKLRLPPKETYSDFIKTLKTKKKLRCYSTILDE